MNIKPVVRNWLLLGAILVWFQIFIGGVTRLTESGLSITEWEIVEGTLPPMTAEAWSDALDEYKQTPQYVKINDGMTMSEFKFIYFWEYFHRLWARMMGFVFLFPLLFFMVRGWIPRRLVPNLVAMFLGAAIVAVFGWIMVASGLKDRPWVNAYKLSVHLGLALILYCIILWTWMRERWWSVSLVDREDRRSLTIWSRAVLLGLSVQILLGGWMSGMKAALLYPSWPDMNGKFLPDALKNPEAWKWSNVIDYDGLAVFMPALVQFSHRMLAYLLTLVIVWWWITKLMRHSRKIIRHAGAVMIALLVLQVLLGISTLVQSIGSIPVGLGSAHQMVAILLLSIVVFLFFAARHSSSTSART